MFGSTIAGRRRLTIACGLYDRTRALLHGEVPIEGVDPTFLALRPAETFWRNIRHQEFDVAEMSLSSYVMMRSRGINDLTAIPVFPSRAFRHSALYVRADSPYTQPADLKAMRLGVAEYEQTVGLCVRGILADEYGLHPRDFEWVTGREERLRDAHPDEVRIESAPPDRRLDELLLSGEIAAMIAPRRPRVPTSAVRPLFSDVERVERDYFRRRGIFPIMHCVAVRSSLLSECPWLASSLCKAFEQSKRRLYQDFDDYLQWSLPWFASAVQENRAWLGDDWWPYGLKRNRPALDATVRWAFEQGLTPERLTVDGLFVLGQWINELHDW